MAKRHELNMTAELMRARWESIRQGPFGPRERWLARLGASIFDPAELTAAVREVARAKKRLLKAACSFSAFEAAWEHGDPCYATEACHCENCRGRKKWPAYYVSNGISLECLLDQHADEPFNILEIGYRIPRLGAVLVDNGSAVIMAANDSPGAKKHGKPPCESCGVARRASRQRYCPECLKRVRVAMQEAGWPAEQTARYLSTRDTFGNTAAAA